MDVVTVALLTYSAEDSQEQSQQPTKGSSALTVASGSGEIRQLKKLLTGLFKKLFSKKVSGQLGTWEVLVGNYSKGETPSQTDPNQDYAIEDIVDEETGEFIRIRIVCSCDDPVMRVNRGPFFKCLHCDQPCWSRTCGKCRVLFSVDYG